ncbi:MAG: hypothetical protein MK207_12170 [Saprospiraceae bacterium]|nr:hypothetical protein [Saprospiraceae bacterium]
MFFLFVCFLSCNSSKNIIQNKYYNPDSTIVVDGVLDDWEMPLERPVTFTDIQYKTANDASNLYICVRIPDKEIQRRIMGLGMSVFIDTLAKRRDKVGVGYPLALTQNQIEKISFEAQKDGIGLDDRALDKAYAKISQEFELIGFIEEDIDEKIRVSNLASKDLKTAIGFDHVSAMICEFKIPLNMLFNHIINYSEILSIGIRVNPPEANADNDSGLFDDVGNNPITGSNQQSNPMMGGIGGQQPGYKQPSRSSNGNITGVWMKVQLNK